MSEPLAAQVFDDNKKCVAIEMEGDKVVHIYTNLPDDVDILVIHMDGAPQTGAKRVIHRGMVYRLTKPEPEEPGEHE